ncbi:MAG: GNAT family N-acetyltransferase [Alteraurantiacibacter sp.]
MGQELSFTGNAPHFASGAVRALPASAVASGPVLQLYARDWRDFTRSDRIARWDALARFATEPNPFYESWSLLPALKAFDPKGGVKLLTLEADGQLAGLMPVQRLGRYYRHVLPHLRNWTHDNCFLGAPLIAKGFERLFWEHVFGWADACAGGALFLHIAHVPATGPIRVSLAATLAGQERIAATVYCEERAALVSRAGPECYLRESLSAKKRKELRRQQRRLEDEGELTFHRQDDDIGLDSWCRDFLQLEARGWKGDAGSALACKAATARLFTRSLEGAARRGRLERLAYRLDGKPIAMLANFLCPPGAFSFKTAFDEAYAKYSPGVLLQVENLELLRRDGVQWADSCAAQGHPMIAHFWRERRAIARHSIAIGGPLRRRAFAAIVAREIGRAPGGIV